jgi:hypothetical protein
MMSGRKQQFEDAGVGLDHPLLTRDQNAAKPAQKLEPLKSRRIGLGREIRQAIERCAQGSELCQALRNS